MAGNDILILEGKTALDSLKILIFRSAMFSLQTFFLAFLSLNNQEANYECNRAVRRRS